MGLKCGIVGLPNVGKSTLFNALTKAGIAAANYPFCTIEPNIGIVAVPDDRLDKLAALVNPQKILATTIEFVDIAGLVKGASQGEGLGNKFLAQIREVDAVVHVVRCFENNNIIHVSGKIDPISDIQTIHTELALADLEIAEKAILRLNKIEKVNSKSASIVKKLLQQIIQTLNQDRFPLATDFTAEERSLLHPYTFLTLKPTIYLANVDEKGLSNNPLLDQLRDYVQQKNGKIIPVCTKLEEDCIDLTAAEKQVFLEEVGFQETGLNRLIRASYDLLRLQTFFTVGVKEVRAWTIYKGATAPEAAACIHTDFAKGFIRAEVMAYDDFVQYGGEQAVKTAGKWRLEGKTYLVQDGDIMHFLFNL